MDESITGKELVDEILQHHGVKGQKWGVRRYQNKDGSLTPEGKKRRSYYNEDGTITPAGQKHVFKTLTKYANNKDHRAKLGQAVGEDDLITEAAKKAMPALKKRKEVLARLSKIADKMEHDANHGMTVEQVRKKYGKEFDEMNDLGNKAYEEYKNTLKKIANDYLGEYSDKKVNNLTAANALRTQIDWGIQLGRLGNEIEHSDISEEELQHWGIKGMKWGVRRYQNKDGSLTPAGKKRYDDDPSNDTETPEEKKARLLKSTDAKEIYENRHLLSTNELNERINRIDTEARLASKIPTEKEKTGNDRMRDAKNTIDNVTNLYRSVDSAYSTVMNSAIGKTLAKKLGLDVPKKEFNLEEVWKNRNKLSAKDLSEASQRVESMNKIEQRLDNEKKRRDKEAEEAAKKEADSLKDAQKQMDDYAKTGFKDDKVTSPKEEKTTEYQAKGKDIVDSVLVTNKQLPAVIQPEMVENGQKHVDDVIKKADEWLKKQSDDDDEPEFIKARR